ncbi:hypothetical protein MNBD_DELTA03-368 [hydrothermal vent metagenome]|uniref:Uncharacterized protein n=1 Tax=hydrothermal vent metagenome TaxID=652676 RepID=A0A3B0VMS1_9ZZZZ
MAARYIWWKTPEEAITRPQDIIAQVMNMGDYDDVRTVNKAVGDDVLRDVLTHTEAGWFNKRSWTYWHYRLGIITDVDTPIPPLPVRSFLK